MNTENNIPLSSEAAPAAAPLTTPAKPALLRRPAVQAGIGGVVVLGILWWSVQARINTLQVELAQRLSAGDNVAHESLVTSKQNREEIQELIAKVGVLEAQLNEAQGQQAALQTMYQELAQGRDERVLSEIEQSVAIASQQLQLAGNVETALIALQSADARLARSNNPQFAPLRRSLAHDIDRLKALPQADISGIALKLEGVVAVTDTLPLAYAQRPLKSATPAPAKATPKPALSDSAYWTGLVNDVWQDMKQLVRIERMDKAAPALLAPSQALFLRENLRLRLVNARLSLLQRDSKSFRDDLLLTVKWLELYFDMRSPEVKAAHDLLQRLGTTNLNLAVPKLDETLAAVRNIKLPHEKR
ncbi:MAG TPA: uroporphyrinogen-III C-methyltransferase [Rhodocyclaceae bacterium]|jgi:uroporphyrin-3 C-methyltransferase|nr:uroporphyrinogen-III C-methyltransferase [Rhodocyclaceae bacterium]